MAAATSAYLLASSTAHAEPLEYRLDASAGLLGLSRFAGEEAAPLALTFGTSAAVFPSRWIGAGLAITLSQPESYSFPCEAGRFCLRRFYRFGAFAESRWLQRQTAVAWEPWVRLGIDAVQAARRPPGPDGDPGVGWALGVSGRAGSDLRLRWLLLGIYAEAVFATGDIERGLGLGLHVGVALGERGEPAPQ